MDKNVARDRDFYRELEGLDKESKVHSCMGHMACSLIGSPNLLNHFLCTTLCSTNHYLSSV